MIERDWIPPGTSLALCDTDGGVVARYPEARRFAGTLLPECTRQDIRSARKRRFLRGVGLDRVERFLGVDGKALAAKIKELSPSTPVILLSGWGNFMNLSAELPENVDCLLGKPPTMARLLAAMHEVLAVTTPKRSEEVPE